MGRNSVPEYVAETTSDSNAITQNCIEQQLHRSGGLLRFNETRLFLCCVNLGSVRGCKQNDLTNSGMEAVGERHSLKSIHYFISVNRTKKF